MYFPLVVMDLVPQISHIHYTLKPRYNEPQYSEFWDILNQHPF